MKIRHLLLSIFVFNSALAIARDNVPNPLKSMIVIGTEAGSQNACAMYMDLGASEDGRGYVAINYYWEDDAKAPQKAELGRGEYHYNYNDSHFLYLEDGLKLNSERQNYSQVLQDLRANIGQLSGGARNLSVRLDKNGQIELTMDALANDTDTGMTNPIFKEFPGGGEMYYESETQYLDMKLSEREVELQISQSQNSWYNWGWFKSKIQDHRCVLKQESTSDLKQ